MSAPTNEWATEAHAGGYLQRPDQPHRDEGESVLWELLPPRVTRVLDLGTGDGRLLARLDEQRRFESAVALDFSPTMLDAARARFRGDARVDVVEHNLEDPLPDLGRFDVVISSFAIHHCRDERKGDLYREVFDALDPGGLFANLEHVASPTTRLHREFYARVEAEEDPANKLVDVETHRAPIEDVVADLYRDWRAGDSRPAVS